MIYRSSSSTLSIHTLYIHISHKIEIELNIPCRRKMFKSFQFCTGKYLTHMKFRRYCAWGKGLYDEYDDDDDDDGMDDDDDSEVDYDYNEDDDDAKIIWWG